MSQQYSDPWEAAANPPERGSDIWGAVATDAFFCILQKGSPVVPFDPQQHRVEDQRCQIEIAITPLAETRMQYVTERKMLTDSNEWAKIVWPSLKKLGLIKPNELNGKWAHAALTDVGRQYTNAAGETKKLTTFQFQAIYDTEQACVAAYLLSKGQSPAAPVAPVATVQQAPSNKDRETALEFVKAIIKQNNGDEAVIAQKILSFPPVAAHFTIQSPEVMQALLAYRTAQYESRVAA